MLTAPVHRSLRRPAGRLAVLLCLAAAAVWLALGRTGPAAPPAAAGTALARVVRTDLVTTQPVAGTIGYGPTATLTAPASSTPQAVDQARAAVTTSASRLAADRVAATDGRAVDDLTLSADVARQQADCGSPATSTACAGDRQKVALDHAQARQHADQTQVALDGDQAALAEAQQQLDRLQATAGSPGNFYTGLPTAGAVVAQGQPLYRIDGRPVPLLYGALPAYRVMRQGVSGDDVRQLEQDLLALGFATAADLTADGSFSGADAAAVRRWQAALGVAQTGAVNLGDAVFLPGAVRVAALHASAGDAVEGGQPVLDYTSSTRLVSVALSPDLSALVRQGDAVTVDLPDGHTRLPGRVASVASVASAVQQEGGGQGGQTQNGAPQATLAVSIAFDDPSRVTALDQAPVTVDVTTQSAPGVMAVPVNALLALAGGGYGVEVVDARGRHRVVTVQAGIFDSGRVQVSGGGLSEGMNVVVPSS